MEASINFSFNQDYQFSFTETQNKFS